MAAPRSVSVNVDRLTPVTGGAVAIFLAMEYPDTATAAEAQAALLDAYKQAQTELAEGWEER